MPRWTEQELRAYELRRKNSAGNPRLRANNPQSTQGNALVNRVPRKDSSWYGSTARLRIRFTIYSTRPSDWDGYSIKQLQDMLIRASILPDDDWRILQGEVISKKAYSKAEERTEITIEAL